jgi:CBS domain-containing protein
MTPSRQNIYELIYHQRSRFFLQKFKEGPGSRIFIEAVNMSPVDAQKEAEKLGQAMDSYGRKLYHVEIKARRFNKSYAQFILQPEVTALRLTYILNTLSATYPRHYHKMFAAVTAYIFHGTMTPNQGSNLVLRNDSRPSAQLKERTVEDLMIPGNKVITLPESATVKDFFHHFIKYGYHGYPVVNDYDTIVGSISYWHIKKADGKDDDLIKNLMYKIEGNDPIRIPKSLSIEEAYRIILIHGFSRLFVYDRLAFAGLIAKTAILRTLHSRH